MDFGGATFSVNQGQARSLSVDRYLQSFGVSPFDDDTDVQFQGVGAETEGFLGGENTTQQYFDAIKGLNQFGLAAASKGHNVFNPSTIEGRKLGMAFREIAGNAEQKLAALKTDAKVKELGFKAKGNKNLLQQGSFSQEGQLSNFEDLDAFIGTSILDRLNTEVNGINDEFAIEFDNPSDATAANQQIELAKVEIKKLREVMKNAGYNDGVADQFINNAVARIGQATSAYDPLLSAKKQEIQSKVDKNNAGTGAANALARKRNAEAAQVGKGGGKNDSGLTSETLQQERSFIEKAINGDESVAGSFITGDDGIFNVKFDKSEFDDGKLKIELQTKGLKKSVVEIDYNNPASVENARQTLIQIRETRLGASDKKNFRSDVLSQDIGENETLERDRLSSVARNRVENIDAELIAEELGEDGVSDEIISTLRDRTNIESIEERKGFFKRTLGGGKTFNVTMKDGTTKEYSAGSMQKLIEENIITEVAPKVKGIQDILNNG